MFALLGDDEVRGAQLSGEDTAIFLGFQHGRPGGQGERVEEFAVDCLRHGALEVLLQRQRAERLGDCGFIDDFYGDATGGSVGGSERDFDRSAEFFDLLLHATEGAQGDTQRHKIPDSRAHPHYIEQRMCQQRAAGGYFCGPRMGANGACLGCVSGDSPAF